jgi:ADP-ribose pyrophosphatase YjhB (NUDIX family)
MLQMYKVFIQNRPLHFISDEEFINNEGISISEKVALSNQKNVFQLLEDTPESIGIFIISDQPLACLKSFLKNYDFIEAAGGIVRKENQYLFIYKNDCWDLPKGIIDSGESPELAAIREVEEECGITNPKINQLITITYHTYMYEEKPVLKKTHWFDFTYEGAEKLKAQSEEGITAVAWKTKEDIDEMMENTYLSIKEVVNAYFD